MELFDKKFVHFMWEDELEGKTCFVADDIDVLQEEVMKGISTDIVHTHNTSTQTSFPFETIADYYRFAYYDPNYGIKKAYMEGTQVQYRSKGTERWHDTSESDITDIECKGLSWFDDDCEYRIKPKESNRMTYRQLAEWLAKGNGQQSSTTCSVVYTFQEVIEKEENKEVPADYKIRRWDSDEWIEPALDVYLEDCRKGV